jgi:group I intron endonuclease
MYEFDAIEYFLKKMDLTMVHMSYTYERVCNGNIYLQVFPNGKLYAGQTINFDKRMTYYNNKGNNIHHTNALIKYGFDNVRIIRQKVPRYLMNSIEIFLISFYDLTNRNNGYNKSTGGTCGFRLSASSRKKISIALTGCVRSQEHRAKISATLTGKTPTTEARANMSKAKRGKQMSSEARANMSKAQRGKKVSSEARMRMSISHLGKSLSDNHRKNISTALNGRTLSAEHSANIGKANKGKTRSAEVCAKMSISRSGEKGSRASPVCAFGKVYACSQYASEALMEIFEQNTKTFISKWIFRKKYPNDIFKINKDFYSYVLTNDIQNITKEMYENWQ